MTEPKEKPKVIKRAEKPQNAEDYQRRHEDSLLKILIEKNPERARKFLNEIQAKT